MGDVLDYERGKLEAKQAALREVRDQAKRALEMADAALGGGP